MGDGRVDVYFCGGSHLGNRGLAPTQIFPVLVARRLRTSWNGRFGTLRTFLFSEDPVLLGDMLHKKHTPGRDFILVLLPRNIHFGIVPWRVRGWLSRLRGGAAPPPGVEPVEDMVAEDPPSPAIKGRGGINAALGAVFAAALPARTRHYRQELERCVTVARKQGALLVVVGTPVPLSRRRFPGTWLYQSAFARAIRKLPADRVRIADVFRVLSRARQQHVYLGEDPFHLTAEGHRLVAEEVLRVLDDWSRENLTPALQPASATP